MHLELFRKQKVLSNPVFRKNLMERENGPQTAAGVRKLQKKYMENSKRFGFGYCEWAENPFVDPDQATVDAWYEFKADNNLPAGDDWDGL